MLMNRRLTLLCLLISMATSQCTVLKNGTTVVSTPQVPALSLTPDGDRILPLETSTVISNINVSVTERCLNSESELNLYSVIGVPLLQEDQGVYSIDLVTNKTQELIGDTFQIGRILISPDNKKAAYITQDSNGMQNLVIQNLSTIILSKDLDQKRLEMISWLDKNKLLLLEKTNHPDKVKLIILNVVSNEFEEIDLDYNEFPNFDAINYLTGWWPANIAPAPSLDIVLYPSLEKGGAVNVWDTKTKKVIGSISAPNPFTFKPQWSIDGQYAIVVGQVNITLVTGEEYMEFFEVSREGAIKQLSSITTVAKYTRIYSFEISPTDPLVAFWVRMDNSPMELAILDIKKKLVTTLCVYTNPGQVSNIYWAPDGKNIIVEAIIDSTPTLLLINIPEYTFYKLGRDIQAHGWLLYP